MKMSALAVAIACFLVSDAQAQGWEMIYEKNSWGEPTSDRAAKSPIADSTTVDLKAMLFVGCQRGIYLDIALERAGWRDQQPLEVTVRFDPHDTPQTAETKYGVDAVREANIIKFREPIKLLRAMAGKGITSEPQRRIGVKIPWQGRRQAVFFWDISQQHLRQACPNYLW